MLTPKELLIRAAALTEHCKTLGLDDHDSVAALDLAIKSLFHANAHGRTAMNPFPVAPTVPPPQQVDLPLQDRL